jgi:AcrR family transcriptional regulator
VALLAESDDPAAISVRAVAERVGCSTPALYMHFSDRTSLIACACAQVLSELPRVLSDATVDAMDPVARMVAISRAFVDFGLAHRSTYRAMIATTAPLGSNGVAVDTTTGAVLSALEPTLEDAIVAGWFAPVDPHLSAFALWCTLHGLVSLLVVMPQLIAQSAIYELVDQVIQQRVEGILRHTTVGYSGCSVPR